MRLMYLFQKRRSDGCKICGGCGGERIPTLFYDETGTFRSVCIPNTIKLETGDVVNENYEKLYHIELTKLMEAKP